MNETIYSILINLCLNKNFRNRTCIQLNKTSSYCLCTDDYCRLINPCISNPCTNNGIYHQLSSTGDFSCQCLPNHSAILSKNQFDYKNIHIIHDENLSKKEDVLTKSIKSSHERNDSGYESNEDPDNYLEQIINNYQREQFHVYPVFHETRSSNIQRSISMSAQKSRRKSLIGNSQTLKPFVQRRSTLFDSNIGGRLIPRFQNEDTSKFVIETLWNTFSLVNNIFLQRPKKRRNAISGESNIQPEQLAYLQQLYSLDQQNSILTETLLESQTRNLRSIVFDILSTSREQHCNCYGNHHIPSCIYYNHSLTYIKRFIDTTRELEKIFYDILRSNKPRYQDATTQSYIEKSRRSFTHCKLANNVATQSSPIGTKTNISTQTIDINQKGIEYINILPQIKTKLNDHNYMNTCIPEEIPSKKTSISTRFNPKQIEDNNIYDRRNNLMNELKQVLTSSNPPKPQKINEDKSSLPNHTVRSLVSMFETTSAIGNSNLLISQKEITDNPNVLIPPLLNITTEEIHSSNVHDKIEQYANDIASNIVDNAVLKATTTTTTVCHNKELKRRFSLYKNGGGHGKNLLFQANTFVPSITITNEEIDQNLRAGSHSSSELLNDPLPSTIPINIENESRDTLIVDRSVDGNEYNRLKIKRHRSSTLDNKLDFDSSSSDDDEQIDHQQFLSNSQLHSAQQVYIRPWLVRRSTAPNIHSLDNDINDAHIATVNSSKTFFSIFSKKNNNDLDLYTRYTCLITILFYLRDIHDEYSNKILYDEIDQIEQSNTFQIINPGRKILSKEIEWKRVKIIVRRFRKKYRYYKQLMKNDEKIQLNYLNIENYFKYFDSISKYRIKKYAKHYAEKL